MIRKFWLAPMVALTVLAGGTAGHAFNANDAKKLRNTNACKQCDLAGVLMHGADLSGAVMTGSNLTAASFDEANLTNADFRRADLSAADLSEANLTNAKLQESNLSGAFLRGTNLTVSAPYAPFAQGIDARRRISGRAMRRRDLWPTNFAHFVGFAGPDQAELPASLRKFQGISSSSRDCGWPAASASSVAFKYS